MGGAHPIDLGVGAGKVEGLASLSDDEHADLAAAQLGQIVCLFEESSFALAKCDLQRCQCGVLYSCTVARVCWRRCRARAGSGRVKNWHSC